jgi:hypothetical protein
MIAAIRTIEAMPQHFSLGATKNEPGEPKIKAKSPHTIQPAPSGPHKVSPQEIDRAVKIVIGRRMAKSDA